MVVVVVSLNKGRAVLNERIDETVVRDNRCKNDIFIYIYENEQGIVGEVSGFGGKLFLNSPGAGLLYYIFLQYPSLL